MNVKELKLSVTNCYLVGIGDRYLLVDTGYENDWALFCKRLKEAGVDLSQVSHLLLTHHHDDHCGLLNQIVEQNGAIRIIMSSRASEYLLAGKNDKTHVLRYVNKRVNLLFSLIAIFDKRWKTHPFPVYKTRETDILLRHDTRFNEIGIGLNGKILEMAGHSPDSISIVFDDGDCIVGDAAANLPAFLGINNCVIIIEDLEAYYHSWRKLLSAGARRIYPAHGKPFPAQKLEQNIDRLSTKHMVVIS